MHLVLPLLLGLAASCSPREGEEGWAVYALEYGRSPGFKRASLVQGGEGRQPASWMVWVVRDGHTVVLVDTGFDDAALAEKWRVGERRTAVQALGDLGLAAGDVDHVVLTHLHWDHAGLLSPWEGATFWVQAAEVEWASGRVSEARPLRGGIRLETVTELAALEAAGRVRRVEGDVEALPGLWLHQGTGHTEAIQWVEVRGKGETVVLASDTAYLFENVELDLPIGATGDAEASRAAVRRMVGVASRPELVVPGHDPLVFERYERVGPRAVRVR